MEKVCYVFVFINCLKLKVITEDNSKRGFAFHESQDTFKGLKLLRKVPMFKVEVCSLNFD